MFQIHHLQVKKIALSLFTLMKFSIQFDAIKVNVSINIRFYHECEIEKSFLRFTVWHHKAYRVILFVCFIALHPSKQLWSLPDGQFTLPHLFPGQA